MNKKHIFCISNKKAITTVIIAYILITLSSVTVLAQNINFQKNSIGGYEGHSVINSNDGSWIIACEKNKELSLVKIDKWGNELWNKSVNNFRSLVGEFKIAKPFRRSNGNLVFSGLVSSLCHIIEHKIFVLEITDNGDIIMSASNTSNGKEILVYENSSLELIASNYNTIYKIDNNQFVPIHQLSNYEFSKVIKHDNFLYGLTADKIIKFDESGILQKTETYSNPQHLFVLNDSVYIVADNSVYKFEDKKYSTKLPLLNSRKIKSINRQVISSNAQKTDYVWINYSDSIYFLNSKLEVIDFYDLSHIKNISINDIGFSNNQDISSILLVGSKTAQYFYKGFVAIELNKQNLSDNNDKIDISEVKISEVESRFGSGPFGEKTLGVSHNVKVKITNNGTSPINSFFIHYDLEVINLFYNSCNNNREEVGLRFEGYNIPSGGTEELDLGTVQRLISYPSDTELNFCVYVSTPNDKPNRSINYERACTSYLLANNNFNNLNNSTNTLQLYPNPANEKLTINHAEHFSLFRVYHATGSKVLEMAATESIDVSPLATGLYLLEATDKQGNRTMVKWEKK
jgi:hypothetical protein